MNSVHPKTHPPVLDLAVSAAMFGYFLLGFFTFFWPAYLYLGWIHPGGEAGFRLANHYYLRIFFRLAKLVVPGLKIELPDKKEISGIGPAVVVCNHLSFLDPLLLISIFRNASTIVKEKHISFPFFGWIMKKSGFISSSLEAGDELWSDAMLQKAQKTLSEGGVVFIFPEGTRSASGKPAKFKKGAFFFAKTLQAPLEMFLLNGTNILFPPGRTLLNARPGCPLELKRLGRLDLTGELGRRSAKKIRDRVFAEYQGAASGVRPPTPTAPPPRS
ncbi:MAG: lysophospholipid acyltransferase family protein [Pseudomonadota bacterium]